VNLIPKTVGHTSYPKLYPAVSAIQNTESSTLFIKRIPCPRHLLAFFGPNIRETGGAKATIQIYKVRG